ncbi:MAG TPA: GNAT family N-acetyltransferase [Herpetosiphonaceae bacterium]|nr:GNAT family N-acetyltransferase [Herpetosiphonaceae bacterium]
MLANIQITIAQPEDCAAWLELAREVEPLFGPMVSDPGFHRALNNAIERGTAYCVRAENGEPGSPIIGGMLFSAKPPIYKIGWLAITSTQRGRGIGKALVAHAIRQVQPPAELRVTTFGPDITEGQAARSLYMRLGFTPAEQAPAGPEGGSRQVFRRIFT